MKLILIIALLLSIPSVCQEVKFPLNDDGDIEYSEVVTVDSSKSTDLYSNGKLFIAETFVSGKDVTQLEDESAKVIIGKGNFRIRLPKSLVPFDGVVKIRIKIECKDNKYKYTIDNIILNYQSGTARPYGDWSFKSNKPIDLSKKQWAQIIQQADSGVKSLIEKLKEKMGKKPQDW